jgi:SHS2 domain-containing protein
VRAELKSATYHDLALEIGPDRVSARVVFDV